MVDLIQAIFLGVVQGLTEWLPISSSGHLVVLQQLIGLETPLIFDVLLHLGTVVAVLIFFRKDIWKIVQALLRLDVYAGGRMVTYVIIGTVPIAVAGFFLRDFVESTFNSLYYVGPLMIVMGFVLFNTRFFEGKRKLDKKDAMLIGLAQAASLFPGISRSGVTISTALMRKVRKEQAFAFSFMLAIPAVLGAGILEIYGSSSADYTITAPMLVGFVVSAIVGYASLDILKQFVLGSRFYRFAFYCWLVGALVSLYSTMVII